jgi:hypothetical protein
MQTLREDTERVWNLLRDHPALAGFVLIGGTALALRIGHRLSEDLDFAFKANRLPRPRLDALGKSLRAQGLSLIANDPPQAVEDFEIAGLDLRDYQQNYLAADTVKLTFFAPDEEVRHHLVDSKGDAPGPRIATLDELFAMKCLVSADRSKTRDWLDLYLLMRDHGYTAAAMVEVFMASRVPQKLDIALNRLSRGRPQEEDEGYEALMPLPPTLDEMRSYFTGVASEARAELARRLTLQARAKPTAAAAKRPRRSR